MSDKPTPLAETTPTWTADFQRRIPLYILGAIVLALLAGVLTFAYLDRIRREALPTQSVVVALTELDPGVEVTEEMVAIRAVPEGVIPENALRQLGDAVGRVPAAPVMTNEILQLSDFIGEAGAGLSARLPDGRWAVVLPEAWLVSPLPSLQAGDQLDVMAYLPGQPIDEAGVIVAGVEILETRGESTNPEQLILAVSLEDATAVLYARSNGFSLLALLRPESQ